MIGYAINKKGMSISLWIFFGVAVFLIIGSLIYFNSKKNEEDKFFERSMVIDEINQRSYELDFYIYKIMNQVSEKGYLDENDFIAKFKEELGKYEDRENKGEYYFSDLSQIEYQLREDNIELSEDKIVLSFEFNFGEVIEDEYGEIINVYYEKSERFEKTLG